jgi:hypothetical protein
MEIMFNAGFDEIVNEPLPGTVLAQEVVLVETRECQQMSMTGEVDVTSPVTNGAVFQDHEVMVHGPLSDVKIFLELFSTKESVARVRTRCGKGQDKV